MDSNNEIKTITNPISFYDVDESWNLFQSHEFYSNKGLRRVDGVFWTATKVSCSKQAVAIVFAGKLKIDKWDKTFKAGVHYR